MNKLIKKSAIPAAIFAVLASPSAFATNGLAPTGLGQAHKAMGGAATANPVNTMSMATNPAAAGFIDDGWDVGLEVFQPNRTATFKPTGTAFDGNGDPTFLIPEGGYKKTLSNGQSVGISIYGNGGMNTRYTDLNAGLPAAAAFGTGDAGVNLEQLIISPTCGMKINQDTSVGLSLNLAYQQFKAYGIQNFNFISSSPGNVSNNGNDSSTGIGATIGVQSKVSDKVMLGAAYRSKVSMGKLDKYKGLFPDQGSLDMPAALNLGLSAQVTPKTQVALDVERIYYSDVAATGNRADVALPLGSTDAAGFGWDDQNIIKIGVKQQVKPKLALMAVTTTENHLSGQKKQTLTYLLLVLSKITYHWALNMS